MCPLPGRPSFPLPRYGEGWDYAEVANGRLGANASQTGMAGTGVGTFNDRLRDGALGGGPFGDPRAQGVLTGLGTCPSEADQGTPEQQLNALASLTERVLAGVAGNLAGFTFRGADGAPVAGRDAGGPGCGCGYALLPADVVQYVSAHDNETLYDLVALKLGGGAGPGERSAVAGLAQALVAWSQGTPFFHAGDELLRSKSLDRDSYRSGDWFNALDWTGATTCWGAGLPPAPKNRASWHLHRPLLAQPGPSQEQALAAAQRFRALLRVRASTPLLRLRTADQVQARLRVHNRGPDAQPAVLVWAVHDDDDSGGDGERLDARFSRLLLAINAQRQQVELMDEAWDGRRWALHPALADARLGEGASCEAGRLVLPPLSALAWVVER